MQVELSYNPYTVKTGIIVDGEELGASSELLGKYQNRRIQDWIDNFFMDMLDVYREFEVEYNVYCTSQDFNDVKSAFDLFLESLSVQKHSFVLKPHTSDASSEEKIEKLKLLFEEAKKGPFDEFRGEELGRQFEAALSPDFEVNVIATMSSGKSTVINALLGRDLMPAKNEACTATIARIEDCDGMENFEGCGFAVDGTEVKPWQEISKGCLEDWNSDEMVSSMYIKGDIRAIQTSESTNLVLVDTPGPNNSQNLEHRRMTYEAIQSKPLSMVLYVLNATQLNIDDDVSLLSGVSEAMSAGGRQAQDRFVFIANKIDAYDPEQGESVSSALKSAEDYLKKNNILNPLIVPTSAELSKLIRMTKAGDKLTRRQKNDLRNYTELFIEEDEMNLVEHVKNSINPKLYDNLITRLTQCSSEEEKADILSGVPIVEELLNNFLEKHAVPAKIKDAVDSFGHVMAKAKGLERLNALLAKDEEELRLLAAKIEKFENDENRIQQAEDFREKVRKQRYEESCEIKKAKEKVLGKVMKSLEELSDVFKLNDSVTPERAQKLLNNTLKSCGHLISSLSPIINSGLEKDFFVKLESFRADYMNYIYGVLKEEFPGEEDSEFLSYQMHEFSMPNVNELVKENTYSVEVEVGSHEVSTSKWYMPWTWLSTRTVTDYEYQDRINMEDLYPDIEESITLAANSNIASAEKQAQVGAEKAKQILLDAMDKIDVVHKEHVEKIKRALVEKTEKEAIFRENKEKLMWYGEFRDKLSCVLSI